MSDNQNQIPASVVTDKQDYKPGSTAIINTTGFDVGSTIQFSVQIINAGADGIIGTADDFLGSAYTWLGTDGASASDGDGAANGGVKTSFYVGSEYANTTILLTATQVSVGEDGSVTQTGPSATHVFTDAVGIPTAISGYVYHDANNDGIFQNTESGIAGVTITLTGADFNGNPVNLTATTDANGFYHFDDLDEVGQGFVLDEDGNPIYTSYTLHETQPGAYLDGKDTVGTPGGTTTNDTFSNIILVADEPGFNNNFGEVLASIHINKVTVDAPISGDGLTILSAEPISWKYTVTNTGDVTLSNVTVTDSHGGVTPVYVSGDTNNDNLLQVTETWIFSAPGTSVLGPYNNIGSVSGIYTGGDGQHTVTAQDASNYVGITPHITINKVTVDDTVSGDGLTILSGESIGWRYEVTNGGGVALSNVVVTDNVGPAPTYVSGDDGDNLLETGETWIYSASGTSGTGPYSNIGTATGKVTDDAGHSRTATATDGSSYTGINPTITINKVTVDDTVSGDGLTILSGESIGWRYEVTNGGGVALSNVVVTDNVGPAPTYVSGDDGDNLLEVGETWIYSASGTSGTGPYSNIGTATGKVTDDAGHSRTATATDGSSYTGINPTITINKVTVDDTVSGDGLTILSGESIGWRYEVTNGGGVALSNVVVTDNVGPAPTYVSGDDGDNLLEVGETWIYSASGTSGTGPYSNIGTATGKVTDDAGHSRTATATDGSSYTGINPTITINKVTVDDTVSGDGLTILSGESIGWRYEVTNGGGVALSNVVVTDNVGPTPTYVSGDDGDNLLEVGETWIYSASGTSGTGPYSNIGTATGKVTDDAGHSRTATATDGSSYTGINPTITINKVTVDDTVSGDGLTILSGESIGWRYEVTNGGGVALSNVVVTDNVGPAPTYVSGDDGDNLLEVGETWIYSASGTSGTGPYSNIGTATGKVTDDAGHSRTATATDGSSYTGINPTITINKVTVDDTVSGDGLTILSGESIGWRYEVTNGGGVALSNVVVTDNVGPAPTYVSGDDGDNLLEVGETWIYSASGTSGTGPYSNIGTATGKVTDDAGHSRTATATDGSSYTGIAPHIAINKVTVDAPISGDGLTILAGEAISWKYAVTNTGTAALSNVVVTDNKPGVTPTYVSGDDGDNLLEVGETWIYSAAGTSAEGAYSNIGTATGTVKDSANHTATATATDASNYTGIAPHIAINKVTVDAPISGDGLTILAGEAISWKYAVTNTGTAALSNVVVTDNKPGVTPTYVSGDDGDNLLEVGETWIYSAAGTSAEGAYSNIGTATGTVKDSANHTATATATDASNYTGIAPHIAINKVTVDAPISGDGLTILAGEAISWKYAVTNTGTAALSNVVVTDNKPGVTPTYVSGDDGDNLLEVGETWIYSAAGTSAEGAYSNIGTATGTVKDSANHTATATATDASNYTGIAPHIAINKVTVDAPISGDGLTILAGEAISWKYAVTNTGTAALSNVVVTDNKPGVTPTYVSGDDGDNLLEVGETWIYSAAGTSAEGAYSNIGTATGTVKDSANHTATATATDASNYTGIAPHIAINKVTVYSGTSGDGLIIPVGQPISWKYSVTNTGTAALSNVTVTDNQPGVTPTYVSGDDGDNLLEVGETWIYSASGTSVAGSYTNTGTATGKVADTAGHTKTDTATDNSSYTGQVQPGSIGDTVFCDANANGKFDAGEGTVAGVTVKLLNTSGGVITTTTTDVNGNYSFTGLTPGQYIVQFVAPAGHGFSAQDQGSNDSIDSDANTSTGKTAIITVGSGQAITNVDAGILPITTEFVFNGNTALNGTAGNILNASSGGINLHVSAFGRDKTTGVWTTAYLGNYSGGLGVTDRSEDGNNNTHTVDNNASQNNYVLFEFDKTVIVDKAFLGYVVGDSDLKLWVGNFTNAYSNHMTLSDSVLSSMGFTELNSTTLTTTRWADLNAGGFAGNVIVIAADTGGTDDYFKIQKLDVSSLACAELLMAQLGDRVWEDNNGNGKQDAGEAGVGNVTVKLYNSANTLLATTTTDANGGYSFTNLNAGSYYVVFSKPSGTVFTAANVGSNGFDTIDSDADTSTGKSQLVTLAAGENNTTVDAGVYTPACLSGYVYIDSNNDGSRSGDTGIAGATVTLTGTDGLGNAVSLVATTNSSGAYSFTGLRPGTYVLTETQPASYVDGKDTVGSLGGTAANDKFSNVVLTSGSNGIEYNFGETKPHDISIVKTASWCDTNNDCLVDAGDVITYSIRVTNTGGVGLTNVIVKDPLTGLTTAAVSLAVGAYKDFTTSYTLTQANIDSRGVQGTIDTTADDKITNTATVTTAQGDSKSATVSTEIDYCPNLEVEKMVSVDGGVNWYFTNSQGISNSTLISLVSQATGIPTSKLFVGKPEVMAGATVLFKIVVANIGDVTEKNITAKDAAVDDPVLNGASFKFAGSTTIASLAPGAVKVSDALSTTALIGSHTDTVTVKGTIGTSSTVLTLDSDTAAYTGTFSADCNAHTVAYWATCQNTWDLAILNGQKGVLLGDYTGTAWLGGSTTSTPKNMTALPTGTLLFIPEAAAAQLLSYGASSSDVRQQMLAQAIAAQLNIDNGVSDPGYYPGTNPSAHDLIGEAVKWLTGASPFGTGGDVDANNNRILDTGTSGSIDYNTNSKALTASSSGAATAWSTYVDPNTTVKAGDIKVNGQDIKNALAAFNSGQLITSMAGYQVGWNDAGGPTDIKLNNPDVFWSVLKENGQIAGPLQ